MSVSHPINFNEKKWDFAKQVSGSSIMHAFFSRQSDPGARGVNETG